MTQQDSYIFWRNILQKASWSSVPLGHGQHKQNLTLLTLLKNSVNFNYKRVKKDVNYF